MLAGDFGAVFDMKKIIAITMVALLFAGMFAVQGAEGEGTRAYGTGVKQMVCYVHNATEAQYIFDYSTTHVANTTLGNRATSAGDVQTVRLDWYLSPQLAGPFAVNGNVTFNIFANTTGVSANANINLELYEVTYKSGTQTTESLVATGGPESYTLTTSIDSYSVTAVDVHHTFQAGSSIRIHVEIQGGASSYFTAWYGDATYDSRVVFDSTDYLRVADVYTLDYANNPTISFDPNSQQKVVKIRANLTDPFGGYDIRWATVTVVMPDGSLLLDNATMDLLEGTPSTYNNIYGKSISYNDLPVGTYTVFVYAMDNNGYNYYNHMQNYEYGPYGATGTGYFNIGLPNMLDINLVNAFDEPLPGAEIQLIYSGEVLASGITDGNGNLSVGVYSGTYTIKAIWNGTDIMSEDTLMVINGDVNNTVEGNTLTVTSDMQVKIYGNVGDLNIHLSDADGNDLGNADIYISYPNGTSSINPIRAGSGGDARLYRVPGGQYSASVFWKGVSVASVTFAASFNTTAPTFTEEISCTVYNIVMVAEDHSGDTVSFVSIVARNTDTGNVEDFGVTDSAGQVSFRLPGGSKAIQAYWHDVKVYETLNVEFSSSRQMTLDCSIYRMTVSAVSSSDKPLSDVSVVLEKDGEAIDYGMTGEAGTVSFRVAPGDYTLRARLITTYMMQAVDTEQVQNITVSGDTPVKMTFSDYPPSSITTPLALFSIALILVIVGSLAAMIYMKKKWQTPQETEVTEVETSEAPAVQESAPVQQDYSPPEYYQPSDENPGPPKF